MYTDELTYAYTFQPQTSTTATPFDLVLSRPPSPTASIVEYFEPQSAIDFKNKWKHGIQQSWETARKKNLEEQAGYKTNCYNDGILRLPTHRT